MAKKQIDYIIELHEKISALSGKVEEGFDGIHKRQDTTNGKVLRNADKIEKVEKKQAGLVAKVSMITTFVVTAISLLLNKFL